jgi:alpha-D-ribose 1-methylphosphonate 5-triphosphate synthase subunit PhnL
VSEPALEVRALQKTFTLHAQGGVRTVLRGVTCRWRPASACARRSSGAGKSTVLPVYGNVLTGRILVNWAGLT